MFLAARLMPKKIESAAPGTKAPDEKKALIAALKRSATRKLRYCHRGSPSAKVLPPRTSATRNHSLFQCMHGLTFPGVLEMSPLPHSIQPATIGEEIFYVIPCR